MASEGTASGGDIATHLSNLDPALAAVLSPIVGNTNGLDATINAVKQSQEDMKVDLQRQTDTLNRAVANVSGDRSGGSGADGSSGGVGIEHMFMQADTIEQTIKKQIESALANVKASGSQSSADPFLPSTGSAGEYYPCKA